MQRRRHFSRTEQFGAVRRERVEKWSWRRGVLHASGMAYVTIVFVVGLVAGDLLGVAQRLRDRGVWGR